MALRRVLALAVASTTLAVGVAGAASAGTRVTGPAQSGLRVTAQAPDGTRVTTPAPDGTRVTAVPLGAGNNNSASIVGPRGPVQAIPAQGCPPGDFCMYTGIDFTGMVFPLYFCGTYNLYNWNGYGSYHNNETSGTAARLLFQDHSTHLIDYPGDMDGAWDFSPDWFAVPC